MSRKAQFNVEFFTVLILFVGFSAYFSIRLLEIRPVYIREVRKSIIRAESYQISEILLNTPGSPIGWGQGGEVKQIGFLNHNKNKTNLLSEQKISRFNTLCNSGSEYYTVREMLDTRYNFSIMIIDKTGSLGTIECSAPEMGEDVASIKRFVAFDSGNYGEVIVQVW